MQRRWFCAACAGLWASPGFAQAPPGGGAQPAGCTVDGAELDRLWRPGRYEVLALSGGAPMIPFSGDADFDRALGRQLVRLARQFAVQPGFAYADDGDAPNAVASPESRLQGTRGTVLFGMRLLRDLLRAGSGGDMAVLGICAHEFAHIHQFQDGAYGRLLSGAPTVKRLELHADFLAGYFVGSFKKERPTVSLWRFGDFLFRQGDHDTTSRGHHGTPAERVAAAEAGFALARTQSDGFEAASARGEALVLARY